VGHGTPSVHEDTHLSPDLLGELRQLAGELVGEQAIGREATAVEALQGADLARLESLRVAEDADLRFLLDENLPHGLPAVA
jgi:hypothetical protein